ncbi:MAG: glycosyltransferase [Desulfovibrio sp.]
MPAAPLRILVVLPMYGGSLPIGRYCAGALGALGHSVRVFEARCCTRPLPGCAALGWPRRRRPSWRSFLQVVSQAVWAQVQAQEPHLVLALAQAPIGRSLLQRLRRSGVRTAMWFVEDHEVFDYWKAYAPLYDVFAVIQKEPFLSMLSGIGQGNALYLPLAAQPDFHKPLELTEQEKREYGADIGFLGAGYPNRRLAFRQLVGRDFKIWGSDWDGESLLAPHVQRGGARIDADESVKIYNATRVNLNLHSSLGTAELVSKGDFVNPRTFELACMGAFQLVDRRALMPELFTQDELATFGTLEEFYAGIEHFLAHPGERHAFAARARRRVLRDHTYEQRMAALLGFVEQRLGPWPLELEASGGMPPDVEAALSPEIRRDMAAVVQGLGLGPNAGFDDVINALRARSGVLTETEAALLFLDEWRRQYRKK